MVNLDNITWDNIKDNHIFGHTPLSKICIRLNRDEQVTGMYLMSYGEKHVPKNNDELTVEGAKNFIKQLLINKIELNNVIKKKTKK